MFLWLKLAERLGMTLAECQHKVSVPEFNLWAAYFEKEREDTWSKGSTPEQHYLAQLTAVVAGMLSSKPIRASEYLLEFSNDDVAKSGGFTDPERQRDALLASFGIT